MPGFELFGDAERKEVKDVLAYLRVVINLKDTISLRRIINFPPRGIGMKTMDKCVFRAEKDKIELFEVLKKADKLPIRGKQSESLLEFNKLIKNITPLGFFDYVHLQKNSFMVLSDSGTISEESAILKFRSISIRTSTERPEAIDTGNIILGGIILEDIINSIEISEKIKSGFSDTIPIEYSIKNTSSRVIKIVQSYTSVSYTHLTLPTKA